MVDNYLPLTSLWNENKSYRFVIHKHEAKKAGLHYDLRILTEKKRIAASFASRTLPSLLHGTKKRILLFAQPFHDSSWVTQRKYDFEIPEGYGAGKIIFYSEGSLDVISVEPHKVSAILNIDKSRDATLEGKKVSLTLLHLKNGTEFLLIFRGHSK